MPFRPISVFPLMGALLLGGCALAPVDRTPPPVPVSPAQFDAGLARLEAQLASQCSLTQSMLSEGAVRDQVINSDVRAINGQLRSLRTELANAASASTPAPAASECRHVNVDGVSDKELVGRNEWIGLPSIGTYLKARIDSGANTSSLSAQDIRTFERDGDSWVRFKLGLTDDDVAIDSVRDKWIEAPIEREVKVTQANGSQSRPVVSLLMTLGPIREQVEFTLADRTELNYPVLLGRRFLMDIAIIDVAEHYLHARPEFPGGEPASDSADEEATDAKQDDQESL